jgi:hypothetical protein
MNKEQIFEEMRRLPREEQMDVLQRLVDIVAPPLTVAEERGLAEALDEAERGEIVDGPEAFEQLRAGVRGKQ